MSETDHKPCTPCRMEAKIDRIYKEIVGDEEMKRPGLVQRVVCLELYKAKAIRWICYVTGVAAAVLWVLDHPQLFK